ncbi:DUF3383 family protein [Paenibacillus sp. EKM211P]|uniref:DUF3383 family protein n=1 Tax=Paenibacillus sp. EKM211P TaxID=1683679 RepID=UPI0013E983DE|nr:DUF3383 family protein [Paenibacillus sp. EKM211P]KAF6584998.1 DUF3383 family protein [Paenibacillus sp. EKM211P]
MAVRSDVQVIINILRPTPKTGLGRPLIIGEAAAASDFKVYYDLDAVLADFANTTQIYKAAYAMFNQGDNSPESIAVMQYKTGDPIADFLPKIFSKDWYYLISTSRTLADVTAIADAVDLDDSRLFFTASSSKTDLATIKSKKYNNTTAFYHTDTSNYPDAGLVGAVGSKDAGSVTWKNQTIKGIEPLDITTTELMAIHDLGAITYVTKAGDDVTSEGKTVSGEYIDIIQSKHWLIMNIELGVQKLFNRSDKVSFDNRGISQIEAVVKTNLLRADQQGMIAHDDDGLPLYSTTFKTRSQVDPADREQRIYNGGKFEFELAGAIHGSKIIGYISL